MPSAAEDAFQRYLENSKGEVIDGVLIQIHRGRKDLGDADVGDVRTLLTTIKTATNIGLVGRARLPEHCDDLPFHFDYIDSTFSNAAAFRDSNYAFIGIAIPFIWEMWDTCADLSQSARIWEILEVDAEVQDNLRDVLFQNLLTLVITHEFSHHVHCHVMNRMGSSQFFNEFNSNDDGGNMERQGDEADADGYAAYHVLSNGMVSSARANAVAALKLQDRSAEAMDHTLLLCFIVVVCAHYSSRGLIDVRRRNPRTQTHPLQAARLDYLIRHVLRWCEPNRPALTKLVTQEAISRVMQIVADEMWGLESHRLWAEQVLYIRSDEGKKYMKELTTLIDGQKAELRKRDDEAKAARSG